MLRATRTAALVIFISLVAALSDTDASAHAWRVYAYRGGTFTRQASQLTSWPARVLSGFATDQPSHSPACPPENLPSAWHVLDALQTDLTNDGELECTLLVWRPWYDWPIMQWSNTPSPIAANHDVEGESAHIILTAPSDYEHAYRELWAGSALAVPIIRIAAGDVDGDGRDELVALEGDYATGRTGPAVHVAIWRWNGFGFTLEWRSPPDHFAALALADLDSDGVAEVMVR